MKIKVRKKPLIIILAILSGLLIGYSFWTQNTEVSAQGSIQTTILGKENIPNYNWITGNVKGWYEGNWVPYKVEIINGRDTAVTFTIPIEHDYYEGTYYGIDNYRNPIVYRNGVTEAATVGSVYYISGNQKMVYDWTITIQPDENCTLWVEAHLAVGASKWSGATVHTTIGDITSNPEVPISSGLKTIPIVVEEATPSIDIIKSVGESNIGPWYDANTLESALEIDYLFDSPSDIYYKIVLENTGNVPLTALQLVDTAHDLSGITLPTTLNPGETDPIIIGPFSISEGEHLNTATISALYDTLPVSDEDSAYYIGYYAGITVSKDSIPNDDNEFDFLDYNQNSFTLRDYDNTGDSKTFWLLPGEYTFEELPETGWILTDIGYSTASEQETVFTKDLANKKITVELARGEWVSTWFKNEEIQRGTIIIEKVTVPHGGSQYFEFTGDITGSINDGGQITKTGLLPGQYSVTEILPPGWELNSITVDDGNSHYNLGTKTVTIVLEEGETVKAVFTNKEEKEPIPEFAVPETPYGTILSLLTMILGLSLSKRLQSIPP